jgi:formamidopyrimidine-DNA glycosylase
MPELPEVQTVVNDLIHEKIIGAKIVKTSIFWPKTIANPTSSQTLDQQILHIERKGKYIWLQLRDGHLFIHLRMSGRLLMGNPESPPSTHERVRFYLNDGRIIQFIDPRKFGRIYFVSCSSEILGTLGVDPTKPECTVSYFMGLLQRNMKIKSLLLDQKIVSGIGNIYADEALWEAKIHPESLAKDLRHQEVKALHKAIREVLFSAIERRGTSLGQKSSNFHGLTGKTGTYIDQLRVYHKTDSPCFRCKTPITKIKLNGRSTHICEACQTKNISSGHAS